MAYSVPWPILETFVYSMPPRTWRQPCCRRSGTSTFAAHRGSAGSSRDRLRRFPRTSRKHRIWELTPTSVASFVYHSLPRMSRRATFACCGEPAHSIESVPTGASTSSRWCAGCSRASSRRLTSARRIESTITAAERRRGSGAPHSSLLASSASARRASVCRASALHASALHASTLSLRG